jgi:hypothetical protein
MTYQYEPLRDAATDIRVAVLQPGTSDDGLRISFRFQTFLVKESEVKHVVPLSTSPAIDSPSVRFIIT